MRQEMTGFWDGSGISWTICKQSAPHSRQITTPTPHHSIFTVRMLFLTPSQQCQTQQQLLLQQPAATYKPFFFFRFFFTITSLLTFRLEANKAYSRSQSVVLVKHTHDKMT